MGITVTQAWAAIKAQVATASLAYPVYWQGEPAPILPDTPTTFAYVVFDNQGSGRGPVAFGGGRGLNLYRNEATAEAFIFAPSDEGLDVATSAAELFAASLRSFRDTNISCFSADVIPVGPGSSMSVPGLTSVVSSYQCAVVDVAFHFDQIG